MRTVDRDFTQLCGNTNEADNLVLDSNF